MSRNLAFFWHISQRLVADLIVIFTGKGIDMMRIFCAASFATSLLTTATPGLSGETFGVTRLNSGQPIITEAMFDAVGAPSKESSNIQGPSVIRIPDWIAPGKRISPDAIYYI